MGLERETQGSGLTSGHSLLNFLHGMARKLRIHSPGALYHVILRGNDGQSISFDRVDRYRLYLLIQQGIEKFSYRIHAFCFMTNHIHLAVQVGDVSLSRIMQNLGLRYTVWINRTWQRTGHLFQGRYKAILIDADAYLVQLVRYIHLNPVRAGMVQDPVEYPWSGHRSFLGRENLPWLTTDWVLSILSQKGTAAREIYRQFVACGMDEGRRPEFHRGSCEGRILGDDPFVDEVMCSAHQRRDREVSLEEIIEAVCRLCEVSENDLRSAGKVRTYSEARGIAALLVQEAQSISLTCLGERLGREISALSKAAKRVAEQADSNAILAERIRNLRLDILEMSKSQT